MYFLFAVISLLVASGSIVTLAVSRIFRVKLTFPRFLLAVAVTAIIAVAIATVVIAVLVKTACMAGDICEIGGLMEGGLIVGALWLICYVVAYIVSAIAIGRLHSRSASN